MASRKQTIYHIFSTFAVGGPQRRFAMLAREMPDYHHVISAMDNQYEAEFLLQGHCSYQCHPVSIQKSGGFSVSNIKHLREQMQELSPDILCTYNWGSIEAVIANGGQVSGKALVPHLHFEDGFGPDESPAKQNWKRVLARRLFLRNTQVVVPSRVLENLATRKWGLPAPRIKYMPNGVSLERFQPVEGSGDDRLAIGTLGALRAEKNIARLIRAYQQADIADKARLVIAGDGPDRPHLEALVKEHGLQGDVTFSGHTDKPEEVYAGFDLFALSSDTEQMPIALLEAMASGLPVVATDVGDVASMVSSENTPYVLQKSDEAGFARALATLVGNREVRLEVGRHNRQQVAEHFSQEQMTNQYKVLFRQILSGSL
ncbi:MAG: glycosyltransferase [Aquisalinus sp.]|nr:glycosyltransferase [Aquisalinus sp.]